LPAEVKAAVVLALQLLHLSLSNHKLPFSIHS
jgi:hypothetical protein